MSPILTSEKVGEGRVDAKELTEHFFRRSEYKRKAAHNIEVIKVVSVVVMAGVRTALATIT